MEKKVRIVKEKREFLLGKDADGNSYYLVEASWDCGWYWGLGYVERYTKADRWDAHTHFSNMFLEKDIFNSFKRLFVETPLVDKEVWSLLELMSAIYRFKEIANVYHLGGSHIADNPLKDLLKNESEFKRINEEVIPALLKEVYSLLSPTQDN